MSGKLPPDPPAITDLPGRRAWALGAALDDHLGTTSAQRLAAPVLAGERDTAAAIPELAWAPVSLNSARAEPVRS